MPHNPKFLFIPVSGSTGSGEFQRAWLLANAAQNRWPNASIRFVVSERVLLADDFPYAVTWVPHSPTKDKGAVVRAIETFRPDITIFDSGGRAAQYRAARRVGSRTVFISSRPSSRRRGFRWRRMRWLDQHWLIGPELLCPALTIMERATCALLRQVELIRLPTLFDPPNQAAAEARLRALGFDATNYTVWCPGGGGQIVDGQSIGAIFIAAAHAFALQTATPVLVITGQDCDETQQNQGQIKTISHVANAELMGLIQGARMVVVGGGSLLLQALALGVPCLTMPLQRDQHERVAQLQSASVVRTTAVDPVTIANDAANLWLDDSMRMALRKHSLDLNLYNGLPQALDALQRLLCPA